MRLGLNDIARCLGLEPPGSDASIEGFCTDSRQCRPGTLFAALPGERVDGHDFIDDAARAGAIAVLASRPVTFDGPVLVVDDVREALGRLAREWLRRCDPTVVAITGSNGKTTVKEMVAAILARRGEVLATEGNYNNELGLPITLNRLTPEHRFAVLEMGAGRAGDIEYLCSIARPDVGVITNVGPAHLETMGSLEGVARTKGEMYVALGDDDTAVINNDEKWTSLWLEMSQAGRTMTFGLDTDADVRAVRSSDGWRIMTPAGEFPLELSLPGRHNVANALAATAAALAVDVPLDDIRAGLAAVQPVTGRLRAMPGLGGWQVIDDTYNANPASLYAALRVVTADDNGEPWLVLGDMLELGDGARKLHTEMGEAARALGVKRLWTFGDLSAATSDAFGAGSAHFSERDALIEALCSALHPGVRCLVKGSRSMGMEHVVRAIAADDAWQEAS